MTKPGSLQNAKGLKLPEGAALLFKNGSVDFVPL